ncbi:flap endonuclease-1 [Candidatus Woesearchaeota archaeon]|nr:flap endonuclease-1 [Candidatus Woesearchaeota archaeon]
MGVAFKDIIISKEINFDSLKNKTIVLDAYNTLYQFLTTIRGADGTPLKDSKGNTTSHLVGLFTRTTNLMLKGIKPVFVFDGIAPELKQKTAEKRKALKLEAEKKFIEAKEQGNIEDMKKYASRTSRLSKDMVEDSKKLVSLLGLPVVQAPSEGEAQAAYIVRQNNGFAVGSQDFDSLLHGATRLIRNLSITGRRKKGSSMVYETINPEIIELSENLIILNINQEQLIIAAIIIGTDYNPGGIKGIGPKNALKLAKEYEGDFNSLFQKIKWKDFFDVSWEEIYALIKNIPVTDDYALNFDSADAPQIYKFLVEERDFSAERVSPILEKLNKENSGKQQKSLADF